MYFAAGNEGRDHIVSIEDSNFFECCKLNLISIVSEKKSTLFNLAFTSLVPMFSRK